MNKIFKVIWCKTKNCYVVVSEVAKRNGKCSSSLNKKIIAAFLAAGTVLSVTGSAWAANNIIVKGNTDAVADGTDSIAIGSDAQAKSENSIAIGHGAVAEGEGAIVLGSGGASATE